MLDLIIGKKDFDLGNTGIRVHGAITATSHAMQYTLRIKYNLGSILVLLYLAKIHVQ